MVASNAKDAASLAGSGHPGYCTLCSLKDLRAADSIDKRCRALKENGRNEFSYSEIRLHMSELGIKPVSRATIDKHRQHVRHPKERVVTAVQRSQSAAVATPAQVGHDEFLQSLVSLGAQRIAENPGEVTVDQALKAAQIQVQREKKGQTTNVLVQLFTQGPEVVVEGEAREV